MALTGTQINQFEQEEYLIARNILKEEDFLPLEEAYNGLIDQKLNEMESEGNIGFTHPDEPFSRRLAAVAEGLSKEEYTSLKRMTAGLDIMRARLKAMFEFFFNDRLLDAVESIVGPEITLSPIQHIRPYLPSLGDNQPMQVPWHQDQAVTKKEADISTIITAWIPLINVTPESGCLQILPGTKHLGYLEHEAEGGTRIKPNLMPDVTPIDCDMNRGDILFFNSFVPHRGQVNRSDQVRWTMDLRFQKTGTPTGRPTYPEFILRSEIDPTSVQDDYDEWCERWSEGLEAGKGIRMHRV